MSISSVGLPNSLTSMAPATLNRSVMVEPMAASSCIDSLVSRWSLRPTILAGRMNSGISTSATRVICQDSEIMTISTSARDSTLATTDDRVEVSACCAPITSLFSRLTSEPVCVLVKKAIGWRCTCANTWVRRSKISPSPILAEYQRWPIDSTASNSARPTTAAPIASTTLVWRGRMPLSISLRSSSGTATVMAASRATISRKVTSSLR